MHRRRRPVVDEGGHDRRVEVRAGAALVVLLDDVAPLAEPGADRRDQARALHGVLPQAAPSLRAGIAALVEDPGGDVELPDVVELRRPAQTPALAAGGADGV